MSRAQLIAFLIQFIIVLSNIITWSIIGRIIMSWISAGARQMSPGRFHRVLIDITEPFIKIARKIPHRAGMFDFAPLIALIAIDLLAGIVVTLLSSLL